MIRQQNLQLTQAMAEIERQLKAAVIYAQQYRSGWERIAELQRRYFQYQEALLGRPVEPLRVRRLPMAA